MREFHTNLRDMISSIFFRGVWVPFDSMTINTYFELEDEDSKEYQALYREPNYDLILKKLIKGRSEWKKNTSNQVQSLCQIVK